MKKKTFFSEQDTNEKYNKMMLQKQIVTLQNNIDYSAYLYAINDMPNPNQILKASGKSLQDAIELVERDDRVAACLNTRLGQLLALEFIINGEDDKAVQLCSDVYNNLDHQFIVKTFFNAIKYGFQPIEVIWDISSNQWIPKKLNSWPQYFFKFDNYGKLAFMEYIQTNLIYFDKYKMLCPTNNQTEINPYGESIFNDLYWLVFFRKETIKMKIDALERFGKPIPLAEHMFADDLTKINNLLTQINNLRNGASAAVPEGVTITNFGGSGAADHSAYNDFLKYLDDCISIVCLGGNLSTMVESGSLAAASSQKENQYNRTADDAKTISKFINELFRWITDLNFGENVESPTIELYFKDQADLAQAELTSKLAATNQIKFTNKYYEKYFNLQPDEFEIISNIQNPQTNFGDSSFAETSEDSFDLIDNSLAKLSNEELEKLAEGMYKPIVDFIKNAKDYETMEKELHTLFPKLNSRQLGRMINRTGIIFEQIGRNDIRKEIDK